MLTRCPLIKTFQLHDSQVVIRKTAAADINNLTYPSVVHLATPYWYANADLQASIGTRPGIFSAGTTLLKQSAAGNGDVPRVVLPRRDVVII